MFRIWARARTVSALGNDVATLRAELNALRAMSSADLNDLRSRCDDIQAATRGALEEVHHRLDRVEAIAGDASQAAGAEIGDVRLATSRLETRLNGHIEETEKTGRALLERIEVARLALLRSVGAGGGPP